MSEYCDGVPPLQLATTERCVAEAGQGTHTWGKAQTCCAARMAKYPGEHIPGGFQVSPRILAKKEGEPMTPLDEKQAQAAIKRLQDLSSTAERAGDAARGVLQAIGPAVRQLYEKLGVGTDGKIPDGKWSQLQEQEKMAAQLQLKGLADALEAGIAGIDEPRDPASFMYRVHASNAWIYTLLAGAVVAVAVVIWGIYRDWDVATSAEATEGDVLRMVVLMGALGGAIHWMSSLANYIGNGNLFRRWIPYYLLAPFQGAALAMLVYLLLRVGVLAPPSSAAHTGGPAHSLNLLGLYAFSGLTGLFAKQAIEKLRDVFSVIFKRIEAKDASSATRPPAPGASQSSDMQSGAGRGGME